MQCEKPLQTWCIVAASLLLLTVVLLIIDDQLGLGCAAYSTNGEEYPRSKKHDTAASPRSQASCWSAFTVLQTVVLTSLIVAFVYGAFAVLSMFSRQRNASPGTEVCDRRVYDPVFFLVLLFDLVVAVAGVIFVCTLALEFPCCCCTLQCCCRRSPSSVERRERKESKPLMSEDAVRRDLGLPTESQSAV